MSSSYQNLFVTKLPRTLNDSDLLTIFAAYKPRSAKVMLDHTTGRSKGFGFVLFYSSEDGQAACESICGIRLKLRDQPYFQIIVQPSQHSGRVATEVARALYVRNIPLNARSADVEAIFRSYGPIANFVMRQDYHRNNGWVAYVEYETIEHAKLALQTVHQSWTLFPGANAPILAKFAESEAVKEERRLRKNNNNNTSSADTPYDSAPPPRNEATGESPPLACAFGNDGVSSEVDESSSSSDDDGHWSASTTATTATTGADGCSMFVHADTSQHQLSFCGNSQSINNAAQNSIADEISYFSYAQRSATVTIAEPPTRKWFRYEPYTLYVTSGGSSMKLMP